MICSKISIMLENDEVTSLFPHVENVDKGSVAFMTDEGHRFVLDEKTLRRGLACLDAHRDLVKKNMEYSKNRQQANAA